MSESNISEKAKMRLFLGSCFALITTAFSFSIRAGILPQLGEQLSLSAEQLGFINSMWFFGFPISMVIGGLIYHSVGAKKIMQFAFFAHAIGILMTIYAGSYSVTGSQSVSLTHTIKSFSVGGSPTQSIVGPNTLTLTGTAGNVFSGKIDLSPSLFAFLQNGIYTIRTQRNGSSGTDTFTGFFDLVGVRVRYYSVI